MEQILTSFDPAKLTAAFDLNMRDFLFNFANLPGVKTVASPELSWLSTGVPLPILNSVLLTNLAPEQVSEAILELQTYFKTRRVTMCWCTGPLTRPLDIGNYLEAQGFSHTMDSPGMAVDLQTVKAEVEAPSDLEIVRVDNPQTLQKWAYVNQTGYNFSNEIGQAYSDLMLGLGFEQSAVRCYLASLKGEPVAATVLGLSNGIAGIYNVVTLQAARGQGIGSQLVLKSLLDARDAGYRIAALQSSPIALNVYRQLGFEEFCTYDRYYWTPTLNEDGH